MTGSYNIWLVGLSIAVAVMASYTALDLAARLRAAQGRAAKLWLIGGAVSLGVGIWAMHFIGMLAFSLPVPLAYDVVITLASMASAIAASGLALFVIRSGAVQTKTLLGSGILIGSGISIMHYTGMMAMRMTPPIRYDPGLFVLSVLIAIGASIAALWIAIKLSDRRQGTPLFWQKPAGAVLMGLAIAGMHYTAMAAANFAPDSICLVSSVGADPVWLALIVSTGTLLVLMLAIATSVFDARLADHNAVTVENLRQMNEKLERRATELAKEMTHELQQLNEKLEARITGHRLAELALRESEELLRQLSSNIPQLFWVCETGETDQLLFLSPAWHSITGLPRPTDQQGLFDSIHPGDHRRVVMTSAKSPHGGIDHEYRIIRADDSIGWLHTRTFPIRNHAGEVYRIAGITEDISGRKVAEQRLLQLAHYDGLTNLPNRTQFHRSLISTLEYAQKNQWIVAVLFIDIDRFKIVNDTLGHAVGDALLQQVATRLVESLRNRDVVGRLGGDEFAVMLPTLNNADDAGTAAGKLLHELAKPLLLEGRDMIITASIGITIFPTDATDASELLRYADTAMYRAKQEGRNTFRYYTAEMNERAEEKLELESCLRQALDRNEFLLHYQPKLDLKSGRLNGAEALLRWQRPGFGVIPPADFIPLLEETGLIVPVGDWVIGEAFRQIKAWNEEGLPSIRMAVNISSRQFNEKNLVEKILRAAHAHAIAPALLECEITESLLMSNAAKTTNILHELSAAEIQISLDDFGTGYSSLSYLKRFPIQTLKIDRSFVIDMTTSQSDGAMVLAIISMAHNMGLKVVAEGVETIEQLRFLDKNACDEIQGYFVSRPLEAASFAEFYRQYRPAPKIKID